MLARHHPVRRATRAADDAVDAALDALRGTPGVDHLFYAASAGGEFGLLWLLIGAVQARRSPLARRRFRRLAIAMGIESTLVNGVVKSFFRRSRPVPHFERPLPLRVPITSSFPSGHASSAFAAAALLSDGESPARRRAYYALASVIATSRVYVKIHHASDVVAGALLGAAYGAAVVRAFPLDADGEQPPVPTGFDQS